MSAASAPFGLRPVLKAGGTPVSLTMAGTIASAYGTAIGEGDPVKLLAGNLVRAVGTQAGDTTGGIIGSFMGVEYTDANGRRQVSNQWLAATVATDIIAYYTADPYTTYEIQCNATLAASQVGNELDMANIGPANAIVGISGATADVSTIITTGTQRLLRIIGLRPAPDNAFGDAFPVILVQIAKHQWVTPVTGVA